MSFKLPLNRVRPARIFAILCISVCFYIVFKYKCEYLLQESPQHLQKYVLRKDVTDLNYTGDIDDLKQLLHLINTQQNISNLQTYGPVQDDTPVLVVQAHRNIKGLQYLILSLSQVQGVQTALLIFSHSYYHEAINELVHGIDFCKVMQIFYPFSLQLHPHRHPGVDPEDCQPGPAGASTAYCLVRDARLTEHKQHWWWKANFIFRRSKCSRKCKNPVIFLEEDNYVSPDLLHMHQYMLRTFEYFPYVEVISFGRPWTRNADMDLLTVESWRPPFDVGLALNKTTWMKILDLSGKFCIYNDYSWSYSLLHVFEGFPAGHVNMVGCVAPRVLSTKEFVMNDDMFKKLSDSFPALKLFPKKVQAVNLYGPEGRVDRVPKGPPAGSGGWGDVRDQLLCLDPLLVTTTEERRYDDADVTRP